MRCIAHIYSPQPESVDGFIIMMWTQFELSWRKRACEKFTVPWEVDHAMVYQTSKGNILQFPKEYTMRYTLRVRLHRGINK